MRHYLLLFAVLLGTCVRAQTKATGPTEEVLEAVDEITSDFSSLRPLTIDYQQSLARDYTSEVGGNDFQTGTIGNQRRVTVGLNLPVYYRPNLIVATSLKYTFDETEFRDLRQFDETVDGDDIYNFHAYAIGLNVIHNRELFGKPLTINGGLTLDGGNEGFERFKGLAGATLRLKDTERTSIAVGLIAIIDPTSQIPFLPIFRYKHQFKNSPYTFDFVLPSRVLLRRNLSKRSRLSAGSTFGGSGYYVSIDQPGLPQDFEYSQFEINTGLIYEYKFSNSVIGTVRGGVTSFLSNRLTEKGEPNRDYLYRNQQGATGYFSVGISFNPFAR